MATRKTKLRFPWRWLCVAIVGSVRGEIVLDAAQLRFKAIVQKAAWESESEFDMQEVTPPYNWADILPLTAPFRDQSPVQRVAAALWEPVAVADMMQSLRNIPTRTGRVGRVILESRLSQWDAQLDFEVCYDSRLVNSLVHDTRLQALADHSNDWESVREFFTMQQPNSTFGFNPLTFVFLEFDQPTGSSKPSVFVGPALPVREKMTRKYISEALQSDAPTPSEVANLLEPFLWALGFPFWDSMIAGRSTQLAVRQQLASLLLKATTWRLADIGFFLARKANALRVVMETRTHKDKPEDPSAWWAQIRLGLHGIGWRWIEEGRTTLLDDIMPKLLHGPVFVSASLDVSAAGISPKVGFEFHFFDSGAHRDSGNRTDKEQAVIALAARSRRCRQNFRRFLETAVNLQLCSSEKAFALMRFVGAAMVEVVHDGAHQYRTHAMLSHVKVVFDVDSSVELKAYVAWDAMWINPQTQNLSIGREMLR
eukprot:TRINITY_DN23738_c0_g1_i2.p1 TRINITY_DN23738_c0_g1~~TRINITY_DN23738_c0_g1_i2.p1  ORF type:complete len:482 (-),score=65.20 TRINITY_DN23738_c0_g1_i2:67-1512(-)